MAKRYPSPEEKREQCAKRIAQASKAGITVFRFRASNMAAGPCDRARALNDSRIPIGKVEHVPFRDCPHPDQCACLYKAWLKL